MRFSYLLLAVFLSVTVFISVISASILPPGEEPGDSDSDLDGVLDSVDSCPGSPSGAPVDASGCAISQICSPESNYKNHGEYVSCVAHLAEEFLLDGIITSEEKDAIVAEAAESDIGKKNA